MPNGGRLAITLLREVRRGVQGAHLLWFLCKMHVAAGIPGEGHCRVCSAISGGGTLSSIATTATLLSLDEYLQTSYTPDREYIDGQ